VGAVEELAVCFLLEDPIADTGSFDAAATVAVAQARSVDRNPTASACLCFLLSSPSRSFPLRARFLRALLLAVDGEDDEVVLA